MESPPGRPERFVTPPQPGAPLMGRFDERATQPARGLRDIWRWKVTDPLFHREKQAAPTPAFATPRRAPDLALLGSASPSLTWVGHATFLLRLGGKLIATDPIWSHRLPSFTARKCPPGVALDALPPLDVVTVSHDHYDHLDAPTIVRLVKRAPGALFVTPLGNGRFLKKAGATKIVELDWWQSHALDGLTITLVPARHWSMRSGLDRNDALWGGFVFRASEGAAYHSGDTGLWVEAFTEIRERLGPIDWAMLPIGAYQPRWFMEPQHMNPEDAVLAFTRLGARHLCAMHWGTFKLTDEPLGEPPRRAREAFAKLGIEEDRLWVLDVGETRAL